MKRICLLFLFLGAALCTKGDTITFTLVSPLDSSTPGEVVSFSLQQGQAPDFVTNCECNIPSELSPEEQYAQSIYYNVPILVNGVSEIGDIYFCDTACALFSSISAGGLGYLGGGSEPWTGLLNAPQFIPGTYQSDTDCEGSFIVNCPYGNTYPRLTIADTPENPTFAMLFLGILVVFAVRSCSRASSELNFGAFNIRFRRFLTSRLLRTASKRLAGGPPFFPLTETHPEMIPV